MGYSLSDYIDDLRRITADGPPEDEIMAQVGPLAVQLSRDPSWLSPSLYETSAEQGFLAHLLHEELDHSLAVMAVNWLPGRGAPPHDHGTWAVIAGVEGDERNVRYKRLDDALRPGHARLAIKDEIVAGPGELVCMRSGGIHSVHNDSNSVSLSLHTYGRHVNHTNRRQFDLARGTETPFIVTTA